MEGVLHNSRVRRPIRSKRYSRRTFSEDKRPPKRLFTPEIKKYLKDWLVRRRQNPYPNRDEKKMLAVQTGLTYIQVCNWFANWRRKLKNAGREPQRKTWGDLIKTYNSQVQGNVEHFSICSDDSIWEESNLRHFEELSLNSLSSLTLNNNNLIQDQCFYVSSTTEQEAQVNPFAQNCNLNAQNPNIPSVGDNADPKPSMISKWLESAANFKPNQNSYLDWTFNSKRKRVKKAEEAHGREELDAAEALTTLANARYKN